MEQAKLQSIITKFQRESDRACAILAIATLDTLLEDLLRKAMIAEAPQALFDGHGPLQNFSAKIDMAYACGLISSEERRDLHTLRKIRNDFAHDVDHELSFTVAKVADRVRALHSWKKLGEQSASAREFSSPRSRFELCVVLLTIAVGDVRSKDAKRPPSPRLIKAPTRANQALEPTAAASGSHGSSDVVGGGSRGSA
jgi:DNA-binding MltR family transcriptional regulator